MRRTIRALLTLALTIVGAACSGNADPGPDGTGGELVIAVNAPFSVTPYVGEVLFQGAQLAVDEVNGSGGIETARGTFTLRLERFDNRLSPQRALDNVRRAVDAGVLAIVDEGTGVDASWEVAAEANVPIGIVYQGGIGLVDEEARPNVFRMAPTDRGVSFRLAEYLVPKGLRVAILTDDSGYGQQGRAALDRSFGENPEAVAAELGLPSDGSDVAPQVLEARRSGADAVLVWGRATTVAEVVRAARSSGWDAPVYSAPSAADPLVRQQLADRPEWVEGLTFAAGRMTAERGPEPFLAFQSAYEAAFGPDEVGVTNAGGETVVAPPEYAMYPYDLVRVVAAAVAAAQGPDPAAVLDALEQVDVQGANGDERGFNELNHEGVVDDDVYFAAFRDMVFVPVDDDPLSSTLDAIDQTR